MDRLVIPLAVLTAAIGCGSETTGLDSIGETGDFGPVGDPTCEPGDPAVELEFAFGVCLAGDCAELDLGPLEIGEYEGPAQERELELTCIVAAAALELAQLELVFDCQPLPDIPETARLGLRARATPNANTTLDLAPGDAVQLQISSSFDGYDQRDVDVALFDELGELVLMSDWVASEAHAIELTRTEVCVSEPGTCGTVDYQLELGFQLGEDQLDLRALETGTLGDLRIWVRSASGFRDSACGEYGALSYVSFMIARPHDQARGEHRSW